jgi:hypothetical protein
MINGRGLFILIVMVLCFTAVRARAADLPPGVDCQMIRAYVAEHGKARALWWAVKEGYSPAEIAAARRCLK